MAAATQQSVYCRRCDALVIVPTGTTVCPQCNQPFAWEPTAALARSLGMLAEGSGWVTLVTGGLALAISVGLYIGLRPLATAGGWLERLLFPTGGMHSVPWATVFVFIWGWVFLLVRLRLIRAEREAPNLSFSELITGHLRSQAAERAHQELQRMAGQRSMGLYLHRVARAVGEWIRTGDGAAVHRALSDQAGLDLDALQSSINIVRVFVWAAPILGFIGTVLGISMGVDEFSRFLGGAGGETLQMGEVQKALVAVSSSLAFAFNTTLLGLVAALILMIAYTWVQRIEDDVLGRIYDAVNERVVALLVTGAAEPAVGRPVSVSAGLRTEDLEAVARLTEAIQQLIAGLALRAQQLDHEARVLTDSARELKALREHDVQVLGGLREVAGAIRSPAERQMEVVDRFDQASQGWLQRLQGVAHALADSVQGDRAAFLAQLQQENAAWLQQVARSFEEATRQLSSATRSMSDELAGRVSAAVRTGFDELVAQAHRDQEALSELLAARMEESARQLTGETLARTDQLADKVAVAVRSGSDQLVAQVHRDQSALADAMLTRLSEGHSHILEANTRVAGQVTSALGDLGGTLSRVDESLANLRTPFEIRFVPRTDEQPEREPG